MIDNILSRIKSSQYLLSVLYIGVGGVIASVFSYLLLLFLGRNLSIAEFGSFNALLSLSYLIGVPASVFGVSLVKRVTELAAIKNTKKLTALYRHLIITTLLLGAVVTISIYILRNYISQTLQIYDLGAITIFGILMGLSFLSAIQSSYLQGLMRYRAFSFFSVVSSVFRFIFPVVAVFLGYKMQGAFGGMVVGVMASFLTAYVILRKNLSYFEVHILSYEYKKIALFAFPVFFVQFGLMLLNNIDVILVKRYFDINTAGYYAGVVTLGKIFLFGAGIVSTVMFPTISTLISRGEEHRRAFFKLLFLQLLLVLGGVIVYSLIPGFLTKVFFGERFAFSAEYIPRFSIFVAFYVLINFFVLFFLAINKIFVFILLIPGIVIQYISITGNHYSLYNVINADIYAGIITLVLLLILFYLTQHGDKKKV